VTPRYRDKKLDKLVKTHRKKDRGNKIAVVYFSCGKHFRLLRVSISSLLKNVDLSNIHIKVSEDYRDQFNDSQRQQILDIIPTVTFRVGPDIDRDILRSFDSLKAIISEFYCHTRNEDIKYACKIDSDVIVIKDVFKMVLQHDYYIVGDMNEKRIEDDIIKHKERSSFHGGVYFLGRRCVSELHDLLKSEKLKEACDSLPKIYMGARYTDDHMLYAVPKYSLGCSTKDLTYDLVVSNPLFMKYMADYYILHFYTAKDLMLRVAEKII
jgi:hypothetical protein